MSTLSGHQRPGALTGLRTLVAFERYPFFSLGGQARSIMYDGVDHGRCFRLTVAATDPAYGLPTLTDADVLIFVATRLAEHLNAREPLPHAIELMPIDFLRALGRPVGGGQYAQLDAAIQRLHRCTITTDLFPNASALATFIDRVEPPTGRRDAYRLHLPAFLLEQVGAKQILSFDPAALRLHGLERRLYGWAHARVGGTVHQPRLIPLGEAHQRAGVKPVDPNRRKASLRQFKAKLQRIAAADRIPGVQLSLVTEGKHTALLLTLRPAAQPFVRIEPSETAALRRPLVPTSVLTPEGNFATSAIDLDWDPDD